MILSIGQNGDVDISNTVFESSYTASFISAFLLIISSPLTIVFWTSLFATKAIEKGYAQKQLIYFGIAAGLATLVFLGLSVVLLTIIKASIPLALLKISNAAVGLLLVVYGVIRLWKIGINTKAMQRI